MPDFQYVAKELSGAQVSGTLTAANEQDALSNLAARQLFPVSVGLAKESLAQKKRSGRRVGSKHLCVFYTQLADLLRSGVPLLRSLQLLEKQTTNAGLKYVIQDVAEQVADGTRLNEAMKRHPRAFNDLACSMIRAGEEGGFMEDVLKRTSTFIEHQEELKSRVIGAMVYPVFLLTVGLLIVAVMLVKFVPEFDDMFARLAQQGQLPWATTFLMSMSEIAQKYWALVLLAGGGIVFAFYQWIQTEDGAVKFDTFRLRAPGLGGIVRSLAISRFCRILGTLLHNGIPILQSLRIAKDAAGNVILSKAIENAAENVQGGRALAEPLRSSGEFPLEVVEMIAVAEEANNLENVLIDIADNTERQTNRRLDLVVRLLEPCLLLALAGMVTFIVAALLLPVLRMSTTVS